MVSILVLTQNSAARRPDPRIQAAREKNKHRLVVIWLSFGNSFVLSVEVSLPYILERF
jgi:hypothetical protein